MNLKAQIQKRIYSNWQLYLFLLVPLVYIIIFAYIPMTGVQIAFKRFIPALGIWGSPWIGFENFARFFSSYQFMRVLKNTLILSFYGLFAGFPIPIILALTLNAIRSARYKKFIQTVTYIPHFISTVVMVGIIMMVLNPRTGIMGLVYSAFQGIDAPALMGESNAFPHIYVWSGIWQSMGWSTIIYIAALSSSDAELHDAIQIDGANRFQRVIFIDLPCILPTATVLLIINVGYIMNIGFEKVFLMQNDLNTSTSEVISTYVYKVGLAGANANFSFATAIGFFNSVINLTLITSVNSIAKKLGGQSLW